MAALASAPIKSLKRFSAWGTTGWIITATWPLYIAQLVGFVFWVLGIGAGVGAEETWIGWALDFSGLVTDASGVMIGIGMGIGAICVVLGLLAAYVFYLSRGISSFSGRYSILVLAVIFALSLTPICFLPLVWFWCFYVALSQGKE